VKAKPTPPLWELELPRGIVFSPGWEERECRKLMRGLERDLPFRRLWLSFSAPYLKRRRGKMRLYVVLESMSWVC